MVTTFHDSAMNPPSGTIRGRTVGIVARFLARCLPIALSAAAHPARAVDFPERPVTIVVPFTPGGSNDLFARAIAPELTRLWGVPVVIENRPGGGGSIGASATARAAPDGQTLMLVSATLTINAAMQPGSVPDPVRQFTALGMVAKSPMMMIASPASGLRSIAELITRARSTPQRVTYASSGEGSINQIGTEMLAHAAGLQLTHIPYKGGAQAVTDVSGNHVDLYLGSVPQVLAQAKAGKVQGLALTSAQRSPLLPEVPTIAETVPGYNVEMWWGVFGPPGIPRERIERISADVLEALSAARLARQFETEGALVSPLPHAAFSRFVGEDLSRWQTVAAQIGVGERRRPARAP